MHEKRKLQEQTLISNIDICDDDLGTKLGLVDPVRNVLVCGVDVGDCDSRDVLLHPVIRLIKMKAALPPASPDDYLCTGLVAMLPREPCLMCAMSLTHSRIRAVLLTNDRDEESIGSSSGPYRRWGLHEMGGLNHHYPVYEAASIDEH